MFSKSFNLKLCVQQIDEFYTRLNMTEHPLDIKLKIGLSDTKFRNWERISQNFNFSSQINLRLIFE